MAGKVGGSKGGPVSEPNVIPFIDILLVLLIIFMVLTQSMLKHMTANVPRKNNDPTPPDPATAPIVLEYTKNREITVNTESVALEDLLDRWPGTLSLLPETLSLTVREIADFLIRTGFRRLLLVNSHWGNTSSLRCAIDRIRFEGLRSHDCERGQIDGFHPQREALRAQLAEIEPPLRHGHGAGECAAE